MLSIFSHVCWPSVCLQDSLFLTYIQIKVFQNLKSRKRQVVNLKEDEKNLKMGKEEQVEFSEEDKGEKEREAGRRAEVKDGMSRNPASSDGRLGVGAPHSLHVAGGEQSSVTRVCLLSGNSKHVREEQELAAVLPQALQRGHQTPNQVQAKKPPRPCCSGTNLPQLKPRSIAPPPGCVSSSHTTASPGWLGIHLSSLPGSNILHEAPVSAPEV